MNRNGGKLKCLLTSVALLVSVGQITAGTFTSGHMVSSLTMEQGLPSDFVDDVYMDQAGFLWIATSGGGLCRYDGYDFVLFSTATDIALKSNFVRNVVEDRFGRLWIASEGGLDILDLKTFKPVDLGSYQFEYYQFKYCNYVGLDSFGRIWADFEGTIVNMSFLDDGHLETLLEYKDPSIPTRDMVFEDLEQDGSMWTGLSGEVCRMTVVDGCIQPVPALPGLRYRKDAYLSDFLLKDGEVWISTEDGLYRYDLNSARWKLYLNSPSDARSLSQNFITSLSLSPDREIIAATLKGINVYNPITDDFERVSSETDVNGSGFLASDFVNCLKSYGDVLYVGTESAGLARVLRKSTDIVNLSHRPGDSLSIAPNPVNSLLQLEDGSLWVGTVEGGISITSREMQSFRHITRETDGLVHNSVSALAVDGGRNVWVGTWGGGLQVLESEAPYDVVCKNLPVDDADGHLVYIGSLAYDAVNNLMWIGANDGIYYYDCSRDELRPAVPDVVRGCVGICADSRGRLWMGCQQGLYMFDLNSRDLQAQYPFKHLHFKYKLDNPGSKTLEKINCITETSDGTLWFGGNGNGLYSLQEDEGGVCSFACYGLVNSCIKSILEDSGGNLWISTSNGLFSFSLSDGVFHSYSQQDGLASRQFYWNAGLALSDGRLCFGQICGLSIITPSGPACDTAQPRLSISRVTVGDAVQYGPYMDAVRIHERDRGIVIGFSPLTYDKPDGSVLSYRFRGVDAKWTELPAGLREARFTSIKSGNHVLEVRMTDGAGNVTDSLDIPVKVKPYFYHTLLFYAAICLIVGLALYGYQRKKVALLVRQQQILKATVEERTKEISEQKKLLEQKAGELAAQNKILLHQNEELAGQKILFSPESRTLISDENEQFMSKALGVVRENYKKSDMDVAMFCQAMGMSKTLLNKKLQACFKQSASQLISTYRLSIAAEMIVSNKGTRMMNISEIAYEVGYNDPKYFTRCFTKKYGMSPSAFPEG